MISSKVILSLRVCFIYILVVHYITPVLLAASLCRHFTNNNDKFNNKMSILYTEFHM